ncbi:MAG: hypothetical protein M3Q68_00305 [Actinomycetota bacterium]|nr:hypothetical protein [Actinomycetota bacterium]
MSLAPRPRSSTVVRSLGAVLVLVGLGAVLQGLGLGFYIEGTDDALYKASVGKDLVALSWPAIPLGIVALIWARRPVLSVPLLVLGSIALIAVVAGVVQSEQRLRPEAGERWVAAAFVPPAGATEGTGDRATFDGFSFPTFRRSWTVQGDVDRVCRATVERLEAWSERPVTRPSQASSDACFAVGRRDGHDGSIYVSEDFRQNSMVEISFQVTRRI